MSEKELKRLLEFLEVNMDALGTPDDKYKLGVFMAYTSIHNFLHKKLYSDENFVGRNEKDL